MAYIDRVQKLTDITVQHIIDISRNELPYECRKHPWTLVNHGVNILATEDELNAYIAAYGEMHWTKCRASFQNFPFDNLVTNFEIIDWGCGQGIASLSLIEMLKERDNIGLLKKITLIEPSEAALNRAKINIDKATSGSINILPLQRFMPFGNNNDEIEGLDYEYYCVIHLFSNILDIPQIDLSKLAKIVGTNGHKHYIMCMGPKNSGAHRIDQFCSIFNTSTYISNIDMAQYRYTSDTHKSYSCKTKGLMYEDGVLSLQDIKYIAPTMINGEPVYDDYDPKIRQLNGITTEYIEQLNQLFSSILDEDDIIYIRPNINGDTPDMVIVRPRIGILLVNICDIVLSSNIDDMKVQIADYIKTINNYRKNILKHKLSDTRIGADSSFNSLVRRMLYFPHMTSNEVRDIFEAKQDNNNQVLNKSASPTHDKPHYVNLLGYDIFENTISEQLLTTLKFSYTNRYVVTFNRTMQNQFTNIISSNWHSYKQGRHIILTKAQTELSQSIAGVKQKINGVAGSGKTQVLATRAVNAHLRTGKKVLVLTYNITLANYVRQRIGEIRADFSWDNIVVSNYHQFFGTMANNHHIRCKKESYDDERFFDGQNCLTKYAAIFIDEVQDYQPQWLRILHKYFLGENGEFVVFGDAKQSIYDNNSINKKIEGVIGGRWNNSLISSLRFVNTQLANLAMDFQRRFYSDQEIDNITIEQSLIFDKCIKYWNIDEHTPLKTIASNCCWIMNEYKIKCKDIVVLSQYEDILQDLDFEYRTLTNSQTITTFASKEHCNALASKYDYITDGEKLKFEQARYQLDRRERICFNTDGDCMKFSTIHCFKGWESKVVILILSPGKNKVSVNEDNLIYTAITRAKEKLFVLNMGNTKYHSFFEKYK